jgi:hypothetical protein
MKTLTAVVITCLWFTGISLAQNSYRISQDELRDKISGYWIGQCVGNYMGFPFEGTYLEDPVPVMVDKYYSFKDANSLAINRDDMHGYCQIVAYWLGGAFSDNDAYINFTRDGLPNCCKISDLVTRILAISEQAIVNSGGTKITENGAAYYIIHTEL